MINPDHAVDISCVVFQNVEINNHCKQRNGVFMKLCTFFISLLMIIGYSLDIHAAQHPKATPPICIASQAHYRQCPLHIKYSRQPDVVYSCQCTAISNKDSQQKPSPETDYIPQKTYKKRAGGAGSRIFTPEESPKPIVKEKVKPRTPSPSLLTIALHKESTSPK
jgi:hypothetical protein